MRALPLTVVLLLIAPGTDRGRDVWAQAPPPARAVAPAASPAPAPKIDSATRHGCSCPRRSCCHDGTGLRALLWRHGPPEERLGTLMHSFIILALISVQWVLWATAWPSVPTRWDHRRSRVGGPARCGAAPNPTYAATVPHQAFMLFQMMFA